MTLLNKNLNDFGTESLESLGKVGYGGIDGSPMCVSMASELERLEQECEDRGV